MPAPVLERIQAFLEGLGREEHLPKQRWWILLRWILLAVVILAALAGGGLIHLHLPGRTLFLLCASAAVINAFFYFVFFVSEGSGILPHPGRLRRYTYGQFAVDWIFISLVFHYTGGVASPLLFYLLFHVILSSVLLESPAHLFYVSLIATTLLFIAGLEFTGAIPHLYDASFISHGLQENPYFVVMTLLFFNLVLYISTTFVSRMVEGLQEKMKQLANLQQKVASANQKLELLNKVSKVTSSTLGLKPRLDYICTSIRETMGVKGVTLRLLDKTTNKLELMSSCGLSDAYLHKGPVDADKSLGKALRGEPHFVLDVSTDPSIQYPAEALKEGLVSVLSFPLKGRERVIGTLRLYTDRRRHFQQEEMDFLSSLAGQGAIHIENAKIYDTLKRQDEAKNEFILLMTHELRAPLMAIQGFLEVMHKGYLGSLSQKQIELSGRIEKRIESVLEISKGLLDIYQWQSQGIEARRVPLSLKKQIERAVDLLRPLAVEKGLTLDVELPEEDHLLIGTEDEIEKILNNLITNAIKYTPSGGCIFVGLSGSQNRMTLRVKDTGMGIPPQDIPLLFKEFFRSKKAKMVDPHGTGLGMTLVKKIVESLGGVIEINSQEGHGTEFVLSFPKT